jgi:hypothetical protein
MGAADAELLRRHRPYLLWDTQDALRALSAESAVSIEGSLLKRGEQVLAGADSEGGLPLSLELLADPALLAPSTSDRLHQPSMPVVAMLRLQRDTRFSGRIYGRCIRTGGAIWLQYWCWLYDGPSTLFGGRRCEGDWKAIQLGLDSTSEEPVSLTLSQRRRGEWRPADEADAIEWQPCREECAAGCRHPRIYVAPFSHSLYFEAGTHFRPPRVDNPDGALSEDLPEVEAPAPWVEWPGRWGSSAWLGVRSPRGPALRPVEWDPDRFQREARRQPSRTERLLARLGRGSRPPVPCIDSAELQGDTVVVRWRVEPADGRGGTRWMLITVHARGEPGRMLARRVVRCRSGTGQALIPVADRPLPALEVRASSFGRLRVRSETSTAQPVSVPKPWDQRVRGVRDQWSPRVWKWFCQLLLKDLTNAGAATVEELEQRQFSVLDLPLDRAELVAVTEHARRTGLIEPLGQERRADRSTPAETEWIPSESGRLRLRGVTRWALSGFGAIPSVLLVTAASFLPSSPIKDIGDIDRVALVVFAAAMIEILGVGIYLAHRYAGGAGSRTIATQWSRHAVEVPALNRWHRSRVNYFLLFVIAASSLLLVAALAGGIPFGVATVPYVLMFIAQTLLVAWNVLRLNLATEARAAARKSGRG